jgi:hypothetical protein
MFESLETSDKIAIWLAIAGVAVGYLAIVTGNGGGLATDIGGILSLAALLIAFFGFVGRVLHVMRRERDE